MFYTLYGLCENINNIIFKSNADIKVECTLKLYIILLSQDYIYEKREGHPITVPREEGRVIT